MTRGFEKVSIQKDNNAVCIPTRKTKKSVGYDISLPTPISIHPSETVTVNTGIKAYFQPDEVLYVYPRSSLGIKKNITLANTVGIIDSDYYNNPTNEGEILLALCNNGSETISLLQGERVAQCVFQKILLADNELAPTQHRLGGIGSTSNNI